MTYFSSKTKYGVLPLFAAASLVSHVANAQEEGQDQRIEEVVVVGASPVK